VAAMKQGAFDYLVRPCNNTKLIETIKAALVLDATAFEARRQRREVRFYYDQLSKREKQVMQGMITGKSSKVIASLLAITLKTVEAHRASVMKKMNVNSLAMLVRFGLLFNLQDESLLSLLEETI
jgi:FixJ family two-component response regulator